MKRLILVVLVCWVALIVLHFPRATDAPLPPSETARLVSFYTNAYAATPKDWKGMNYVDAAQVADEHDETTIAVKQFVRDYHMEGSKVVDIGSGRGQLQDVVPDYTGLDIAPTAGRYYHKPFFAGSATALPFGDSSFDSAWSVNCMEHIPNPEQAYREMRRIVKNGGLLYIAAAWRVPSWAANGYDIRPYSDFDLKGKLIKASVAVRATRPYYYTYLIPIRFLRLLAPSPTALHYTRLTPNYKAFWNDSDAVNSLDRYESVLWFTSRGDECLSCSGPFHGLLQRKNGAVIIRVHK